jgi:hypothetical protein
MRPSASAVHRVLAILLVATLFQLTAGAADDSSTASLPKPLTNVHAHNDYEHKRPLFDALDCGFCSVEADINLVDGKLLVAHSRAAVKPGRTLESLYLDPLRERVKKYHGRVYPDGPPVWLLIDFKNSPTEMYPVLRKVLIDYSDILTTWEDGKMKQGAVTAILTGSHPDESILAGEKIRYAAIDGILDALSRNPPSDLVPWMSSQWSLSFKWRGEGAMPDAEVQKLHEIVEKAHKQGRLVRFWAAPDKLNAWKTLHAAGVDLINTDDLKGAADFLNTNPQ